MNRQEQLNFLIKTINKSHSISVNITEDTILSELGLDSLDIVELQIAYEEATGDEVSDPVEPLISIKDLIDLMIK